MRLSKAPNAEFPISISSRKSVFLPYIFTGDISDHLWFPPLFCISVLDLSCFIRPEAGFFYGYTPSCNARLEGCYFIYLYHLFPWLCCLEGMTVVSGPVSVWKAMSQLEQDLKCAHPINGDNLICWQLRPQSDSGYRRGLLGLARTS